MKVTKLARVLLACGILSLGAVACSSDKAKDTEATTEAATTDTAAASEAAATEAAATEAAATEAAATEAAATEAAATEAAVAAPAGDKSVGLLFDITGRGDKSFNDAAAAGFDKAKAEFATATYTESAPVDPAGADRPERVKTLVGQKTGLIVCVGFLWQTDCGASAKANPTTNFAIIDSTIDEKNAVSLLFAEEQGSYLVGVAAALKSKSGKLGFIGGVRTDGIGKFEAGFIAGAKATNPAITVESKYATEPPDFSGFNDPAKGKAIAKAMYDSGIDVIYHAAGGTGAGLFTAAKESGKKPGEIWAIGVDSDQYNSVKPENGQEYILTSMLKRVDVATYEAIKAYMAGTPLSGVSQFDLKRDGVGYATSKPAISDVTDKLEAAKADIISGKVVVPTKP
jgi:basic membrane protein A and related proteins